MSRRDERVPVERAAEAVRGLRAGSWESVQTLSMLATVTADRVEARRLVDEATAASQTLKSGSWESARALVWLARARQHLDA